VERRELGLGGQVGSTIGVTDAAYKSSEIAKKVWFLFEQNVRLGCYIGDDRLSLLFCRTAG
jgi:hypothetical protein